jgi:hypothetical protein
LLGDRGQEQLLFQTYLIKKYKLKAYCGEWKQLFISIDCLYKIHIVWLSWMGDRVSTLYSLTLAIAIETSEVLQ